VGQIETARLHSQAVGVGVRADPSGGEGTGSGDHETARQHRVAGPHSDRVGLAGQQRLIDLQPVHHNDITVDGHRDAATEQDHVPGHELLRRHGGLDAVAAHPHRGSLQQRQRVQRALGADFLHDADRAVDHDDQTEQTVLERAEHQHHGQQHPDDRVEPGQHIGPYNRPSATAGPGGDHVALAGPPPPRDLAGAQPPQRRRLRHHPPASLRPAWGPCPFG
jgi:hypothetical protein